MINIFTASVMVLDSSSALHHQHRYLRLTNSIVFKDVSMVILLVELRWPYTNPHFDRGQGSLRWTDAHILGNHNQVILLAINELTLTFSQDAANLDICSHVLIKHIDSLQTEPSFSSCKNIFLNYIHLKNSNKYYLRSYQSATQQTNSFHESTWQ